MIYLKILKHNRLLSSYKWQGMLNIISLAEVA